MRIRLPAAREGLYNIMRQCGYGPERGSEGELVFSRIIGPSRSGYPRFHCYIKSELDGSFRLNLHLDQKKPIYKGSHAHGGEYEGVIVEQEAERIKNAWF